MRNYFIFDGEDSRDYGVYISGSGVYDSPARDYEAIVVPGRDGDLLGIERRLGNMNVVYPAFIYSDYKNKMAALRSMLLSKKGYKQLSDSYHPGEFRIAYFRGPLEVEARDRNDAGEFNIVFEVKPQRFLLSGQTARTFTSAGTIENPTLFPARPVINVTGYGDLLIGSDRITIANVFPSVTIDSEIMDCYSGTNNANAQVVFQSNDFPVLDPGETGISFDGTITRVEIVPRWFIV